MEIEKSPADSDTSKNKNWLWTIIGHGGPVVINPTAVIGNNCNLSQFVTIGAIDGNAAEIGDNVYIGPNCCLIELVTMLR